MALAFDPNRTFFRGINKYKQIHINPFIKKEGKGFKGRMQKKKGKWWPIKVSVWKIFFIYIFVVYFCNIYLHVHVCDLLARSWRAHCFDDISFSLLPYPGRNKWTKTKTLFEFFRYSNLAQWIIPTIVALGVALLYRFYIAGIWWRVGDHPGGLNISICNSTTAPD